ncbi:MAG: aminotransferase class V-fold PLP-dependent enzyme [Deltaproteobacteria bacterium]|nr:aminotransferase class V-fold PLP-dependent enzyme [Deltaproteobacteria bacterium]
MDPAARDVVEAQLAAFAHPWHATLDRLLAARTPFEIRGAAVPSLVPEAAAPARRRRQRARKLGLDEADLDFRDCFPGLDLGIYACSHSMGVPSVAGPAAVADHLAQLGRHGIGTWDEGQWVKVMDQYRGRVATLVGGNLDHGDVTWFPNASDALSAVLECIDGGTLVYTRGHFTTGHYVHHQWSQNTGGTLVEVPTDEDGAVPTGRIVEAIHPGVRVLSISHALFESGWLQDLPALAAALRERAPGAILLLDAYQTAGTVPIDVAALGDHVVVVAAGHKQLRSGTGAGFMYMSRRLLAELLPRRTGWWNHREPFAFEKGAVVRADDGTRFRTGTPTVMGMAMLLGELATLAASAGGDLGAAVQRARRVTQGLVDTALLAASSHGLRVRGDWPSARRAAFVCVEVDDGPRVNEALARQGIRADYRPREGSAGWMRVSGNAAGFPYEIEAVIEAIAHAR